MSSYRHTNINGAHTTVVSSTPCKLHSLVINTTTSDAITLYDDAAAVSAAIIAIFPASAGVGTYLYDVDCLNGLTIVTAGTGDITVSTGPQGN
jgi:hypothetical protein